MSIIFEITNFCTFAVTHILKLFFYQVTFRNLYLQVLCDPDNINMKKELDRIDSKADLHTSTTHAMCDSSGGQTSTMKSSHFHDKPDLNLPTLETNSPEVHSQNAENEQVTDKIQVSICEEKYEVKPVKFEENFTQHNQIHRPIQQLDTKSNNDGYVLENEELVSMHIDCVVHPETECQRNNNKIQCSVCEAQYDNITEYTHHLNMHLQEPDQFKIGDGDEKATYTDMSSSQNPSHDYNELIVKSSSHEENDVKMYADIHGENSKKSTTRGQGNVVQEEPTSFPCSYLYSKSIPCAKCHRSFTSRKDLNMHIYKVHKLKPFPCTLCNK